MSGFFPPQGGQCLNSLMTCFFCFRCSPRQFDARPCHKQSRNTTASRTCCCAAKQWLVTCTRAADHIQRRLYTNKQSIKYCRSILLITCQKHGSSFLQIYTVTQSAPLRNLVGLRTSRSLIQTQALACSAAMKDLVATRCVQHGFTVQSNTPNQACVVSRSQQATALVVFPKAQHTLSQHLPLQPNQLNTAGMLSLLLGLASS